MKLVALKTIGHSVGVIDKGMIFDASADAGDELVRSGAARVAEVDAQIEAAPSAEEEASLCIVILASGPSLTDEDIETVRRWRDQGTGRAVLTVCRTYERALWADYQYAADPNWWRFHGEQAKRTFSGQLWTQDERKAQEFGLRRIQVEDKPGLNRVKGVINSGGNSGYQAIGLAYNLGARKIVLLGFDMQATNGMSHWHGDYQETLLVQNSPFDTWIRRFSLLASGLRSARVRVINASRSTALACFSRASLEDALSEGAPNG